MGDDITTMSFSYALPSNDLITQIQAGIGLINTIDKLTHVNPAMMQLLGHSMEDMVGQPIVAFIKPEQHTFLQNKLLTVKRGDNIFTPITFLRKDGRLVEGLLFISRIQTETEGYQGAAFFVLDIHQDLFLQTVVKGRDLQKGRDLSVLNRIMTEIARTWDLEQLLKLVFSSIETATGFDGGGFFAYRSEKPTLYVYPEGKFIDLPDELTAGLQLIRKERPDLLQRNFWNLSKIDPSPEHLKLHHAFFNLMNPEKNTEVNSVMVLSMTDSKRTSGMFGFYHQLEKAFTPEMIEMADIVTSHAAIAIENIYLIRDMEILAAEKERLRLSRELHDSVAQGLYSLMLYGEASRRAMSAQKTEVVAENLEEMIQLSREAMRDLRLLIFELRPPLIEEIGFSGAIVARLESVEKRSGTHAECNIYGASSLSSDVENELYWIVHESLNNVLKHAKAENMCVDIHFTSKSTRVIIKDDGVGFLQGDSGTTSGVGLKSMAERVARLGGRLRVDSEIGQGTTIDIALDNP
ncbi:MAG TPA: histidine kinase [Anaerolineaceae bacterium]|nr:histidine kinase [Anaerolineaceae bacterium]